MAHPHNEHRSHKVERERVSHIAGRHEGPRHYARGGTVHDDEAEDRALIRKEVKGEALKHDGKKAKARGDKAVRRAKGGHVKHKGSGKTSVNVIVAPGGGAKPPMPAGGPPMGAAPPMMPPKPPMMPPPGGAPPVAGLGGPPGGPMPPRSQGGRAYKTGGKVMGPKSGADIKGKTGIGDRTPIQHSGNKSDTQNIGRGPVITRATGGKIKRAAGGSSFEPNFYRGKSYSMADDLRSRADSAKEDLKTAMDTKSRATGGPIYSDGAKGKQMAPHLPAGSGGGRARIAKARMENKAGHEPWEPAVER